MNFFLYCATGQKFRQELCSFFRCHRRQNRLPATAFVVGNGGAHAPAKTRYIELPVIDTAACRGNRPVAV